MRWQEIVMSVYKIGEDTFRVERSMMDATSLHRPDTSWLFVDVLGHEHRWYIKNGGPNGQHISATHYSPQQSYVTPTLKWVFERYGYYEDGSCYEIGHHECDRCGERIEPKYCADSCMQYVPGLQRCYINDVQVTREEFERCLSSAWSSKAGGRSGM